MAVFLGPISEFIGRQKVLHGSFACFFRTSCMSNEVLLLMIQSSIFRSLSVSLSQILKRDELIHSANNVAVHMIFRFLTGFAGSAFLSVSGGAISDVFKNENVAT
jgi:MFS family permease